MLDLLYIVGMFLLCWGIIKWSEMGLRDYFDFIKTIDGRDQERKNRRD